MSVNNDFGSILSHGTGDVIDDDIHDFLAFFLVVIGALIAQASGQSDTVFKFFTEDLTLDIGAAQGRTELLIFRIKRAPHIAVGQKDVIKSDLNRNRVCNELSTGGCGKTFTEQKVAVSVHHIDAVPVEEESFEGFQNVGIGRSMIVSGPEFEEVSENDELGAASFLRNLKKASLVAGLSAAKCKSAIKTGFCKGGILERQLSAGTTPLNDT